MSKLTYGQRAVGLTFNPSGDPKVQRVNELFAEIIDLCNRGYDETWSMMSPNPEKGRLFSIAITEAETAQMWAVKALTFSDAAP